MTKPDFLGPSYNPRSTDIIRLTQKRKEKFKIYPILSVNSQQTKRDYLLAMGSENQNPDLKSMFSPDNSKKTSICVTNRFSHTVENKLNSEDEGRCSPELACSCFDSLCTLAHCLSLMNPARNTERRGPAAGPWGLHSSQCDCFLGNLTVRSKVLAPPCWAAVSTVDS